MTDKGRCDIIIVSYNAEKHLRQCIKSVKRHTKFPYNIIIVDNNSNKGTKDYINTINNAKVILNKKNYGFGYANNQGVEASSAEYICYLNSDTIVTSNWLTRMITILEKNNLGLVGPMSNFVSSPFQEIKNFGYFHDLDSDEDSGIQNFSEELYKKHGEKITETNRLIGFCLVTKRNYLERVGTFDERYMIGNFEDDDLGLRFIERGYDLRALNGVFIYHYGGASFKEESKSTTNNEVLERNRKLYVKKWYDTDI